eukprot:6024314-Amphidinium_carterae.1
MKDQKRHGSLKHRLEKRADELDPEQKGIQNDEAGLCRITRLLHAWGCRHHSDTKKQRAQDEEELFS